MKYQQPATSNQQLKKQLPDFIGHQLFVERLAEQAHFGKIFLAQGENIDAIGFFVDQRFDFQAEFVDFVGVQIPEKNGILHAHDASALAGFGDLRARLVFDDVVDDPG